MAEQASVLVLDDDPIELNSLCEYLRLEQYQVSAAQSLQEAQALLDEEPFRVALADVRLPGGSGFDLLDHARAQNLATAVIMITGYGTIEDAVRAIKLGAFDYITKPISDDEVKLAVERALQHQELVEENRRLRKQLETTFSFDNLVCRDPKMKSALELTQVVAGTDATVLVTGESGTGKTLVARAIHVNSARASKPFVEVNCGALPDTLLESELFGHVKGAFSGAILNKRGKFEAANKGTILLDEISLASAALQTKLLRILESLKFEPVGSNETREVDVRIILATNQDLSKLVRERKFREDLYYRINVLNIYLPSLRERLQDILPLAHHFLEKYRKQALQPIEGISEEAMRILSEYEWPGNVRELENVIQRAMVLCRTPYLEPADLDVKVVRTEDGLLPKGEILPLKDAMKKVERRLILATLRACEDNRKEAARRLGINRTTLYNKMHKQGIMPV